MVCFAPIRWLAVAAVAWLGACGPSVLGSDDDDGRDAAASIDGAPGWTDADPFRPDAIPPPENAAVYAHSSSTLYRVDPDDLSVTAVGPFQWPSGADTMTDIALDKDGNMVGISYTKVYSVDKDTAECSFLANLSESFNGLSFVPVDSPDPSNEEILIGAANSGTIYQIDPDTGATDVIGAYGNGWGSSGDIVAVRGLGVIATVVEDTFATDKLARIDPSNGYQATIIGDTGYDDLWGIGFWGNQVYGFAEQGQFVLIDVTTGAASLVETSAVNWWGAGVTTTAPVVN